MATKRTHKKAVTRTGAWKPLFLKTLAESGNVSISAEIAAIDRVTAYEHRKTDKEFASGWAVALAKAGDALEAEARRRAVEGTQKPVFHQGKRCGYIREYSDTLLIFLLKGNKPKKFSDRVRQEITGKGGAPIQAETNHVVTNLEECSRRFEEYTRRQLGTGPVPNDRN